MSTVYSGWSSAWRPSGSSYDKKYRAKITYSTSSTNTTVTLTVALAVNINSTVGATFEGEIHQGSSASSMDYGGWSHSGTKKTVFGGDKTVTIISNKTHPYARKTSAYTVNFYGGVSSENGSWTGVEKGVKVSITIPALPSYSITYNANDGTGAPGGQTKYYNTSLTLSSTIPTRTGYTFTGWLCSADGKTYQPGATYPQVANTCNTTATLTAQWSANTYTVSFNGNGNTGGLVPSAMSAVYSNNFIPPSPGNLEKDNYDFDRWNTKADGTGTDFVVGQSYTWNIASDTILYAKWKSKLAKINYKYASTTNVTSEDVYIILDERIVPWESDYTIISQDIPSPSSNYIFSGYYSVGSAYKTTNKEFGIEFPAGVIPYNYTKSDLAESNIIEVDENIHIGSTDLDLYAIYRDNTNSLISIKDSSYEYIPPSVTENDYYLYLTGQTSSFNSSVANANMVAYIKFSINQIYDAVSIDFDSILASLTDERGSIIVQLKSPIFHKSLYNSQTGTIDIYTIFRTSGDTTIGVIPDYDTTRYVLSVSNIKDSFGKSLLDAPMTIIISPPKILRDINSSGNVISLFSKASDSIISQEDNNEFIINSNLIIGLEKYDPENLEENIDTLLYNTIYDLGWLDSIVEV